MGILMTPRHSKYSTDVAETDTPPVMVLLAYIVHLPPSPLMCMWTTNDGLRLRCSRRRWWSLVSPSLPSVNSIILTLGKQLAV